MNHLEDKKHGSNLRKLLPFLLLILLTVSTSANSGENKVLVIGLDGAEWDAINQLVQEDEMENMASIMENGSRGNLTTTLPIESPVAWTSMTTGKTPGKHGIYGFLERKNNRFQPTTASDVRSKRVWDYAGEKGEVVVVNVPQTFPPEKVNGYMISGYLSIRDEGYTYPEKLQKDIEEGNYSIEVLNEKFAKGKEEMFLERLNSTVEKRTKVTRSLLQKSDWKLGFVSYTGLDRLQHYFWDYRDGGEYERAIDNHYMKLDEEIGELLEEKDENTTVMIVSDHGFGELNKNIYMNTWLRENGYLSLEEKQQTGLFQKIGLTQQSIVDIMSRLNLLKPVKDLFSLLGFNPGAELPAPALSDINFSETEVYAGNYGGKLYLTSSEENSKETLEQVEKEVKEIEDPETGEKVIKNTYRPEEIYTDNEGATPDLILEPAESYRVVGFLGHNKVVEKPPTKTGTHRRDGIYIISKGAGKNDADITDIAPTILTSLNMEVPEDFDGESILKN